MLQAGSESLATPSKPFLLSKYRLKAGTWDQSVRADLSSFADGQGAGRTAASYILHVKDWP